MAGKRPVDLLMRNGRYGYSSGGLTLVGTFGSVDGAIAGALRKMTKWAQVKPGGAMLVYDSILMVSAPGQDYTFVGYPKPAGLSPRGGSDLWSPRECQDAVLDGTIKPMRLRPVGDPYRPDEWEPWT